MNAGDASWPVDETVVAAAAGEGRGVISLARSAGGFRDLLRAYKVLIDRREVGSAKRGQRLHLPVTAGHHDIQLKIDWCSSPVLTVEVAPGAVTRLHCEPGGGPAAARRALDNPADYIRLVQV